LRRLFCCREASSMAIARSAASRFGLGGLHLNPHPLKAEDAAPKCRLLVEGGGGARCQVSGQRIGEGFFVPEDAQNPPAVLVVEELDGVDAAGEGFFVGSVAGFVAAENLSDVAETVDLVDDAVFVEGVGFEVAASEVDVIVDVQEARGVVGGFFGDRGEAGVFGEEGAEAVVVAVAGGAGDDGVESGEDGVDRFYVGGVGGGGCCRRCRSWCLGESGDS
jgi:hypothetical protein